MSNKPMDLSGGNKVNCIITRTPTNMLHTFETMEVGVVTVLTDIGQNKPLVIVKKDCFNCSKYSVCIIQATNNLKL